MSQRPDLEPALMNWTRDGARSLARVLINRDWRHSDLIKSVLAHFADSIWISPEVDIVAKVF